jgi:hypothetical protein
MYDAKKLDDRLAVSQSKEQVLKELGKPDRVVQDDGRQVVWEYRMYPRGEWVGYLVHCPFHPYCYFPAESPSPYYLALQEGKLCMWGTPDVVRTLAWKVCGTGATSREGQRSESPAIAGVKLSVIPVFMPSPVSPLPKRLALVPLGTPPDERLASWLDLTLNFLRSRHPQLVLVEREDLQAVVDEIGIQYAGRVEDDTTVRIGRLTGADSLLTYRLVANAASGQIAASFELRLLNVENGTNSFRQITTATAISSVSGLSTASRHDSSQLTQRLVVEEATAYGMAALTAAFGDNALGVVPDHAWPREGLKVLGILQGSPAYRAGLRQGDRILGLNDRPLRNWTDPLSLPALLRVERDGTIQEISVE